MSNSITSEQKLFIKKRISEIKQKKHFIQLFNIINKDNVNYSNNSNGIFFNINDLPNNILLEILELFKFIDNDTDSDITTTDN